MSNPVYTSVAAVKASLGLQAASFADDDILAAILAAQGAIEQQTSRVFTKDTVLSTRNFVPENPGYCIIDDLVEFDSLVAQESNWTLDSDFFLEPLNAPVQTRPYTAIRTIARPFIFTRSQIPAGWAAFDSRIQVTGKWGWPAVPAEISTANAILASRYLRRIRDAPLGVLALGTEVEAVRLGRTDPDVASLISPYALAVLF